MKTCVLYTFDAINNNFIYFIEHGVFECPDVTFIIICDHTNIIYPKIPHYVIQIVRKHGSNYFNSWLQGLESINASLYDHFIFISGKVIGPIIPNYYTNDWVTIFTQNINKEVKLFGSYINVYDKPIVNADIFCLDLTGIRICCRERIFYYESKETFQQREERMSVELLKNNYNIGCLFPLYEKVDFRIINSYPLIDDYMESDKLSKMNISPYDLIFIQTNKQMHHLYYTPYLKKNKCIIYNKNIKIIKAKYGALDIFKDVTSIILNCVAENKPIIVSNGFLNCDPVPNVEKILIIYYLNEHNYRRLVFDEKMKIF
jgi:hypothetical protein